MTRLAELLTDHPAAQDAPVLHWPTGSRTRRDLTAHARLLAVRLGAAGQMPVAGILDGGASAISAMFATWLAGGVYVPVNPRLADAEIAGQLAATGPAVVIVDEGNAHRVPNGLTRVVETGPGEWARHEGGHWTGERFDANAAMVIRTSGTTGASKPVVLEHDGVLGGIDAVIARLRKGRPASRDPMPNLVPNSMSLWAGIWNMLFALRLGAPVILLDRFDPLDYATLVKRFGIRSTILAPAMMTMLTEDRRVTDLEPLRMVRSVTAPLAPVQARRFRERFGVGVLNCYGQTELGGEVAGWTASELREFGETKLGAVGRPHPGVSIRVLDAAGRDVAVDEAGEIWVRSPYAATDALPADQVFEGHLRTGDLGRIDADGFLWVEGRTSDTINRGGLKIVPHEVEEVLREHPRVADACVAGVPDARLGEVPVAWVRPVPGEAPPDPGALRAHARERLAGYKVPVAFRFLDDFPRNEIGKVLRRELIAAYGGAESNGADCP